MHESGIEPARTSVRRSRRSARAIIALAVVCVISALLASYRSWHRERARSLATTDGRPTVPWAPAAPASAGRTLERR